MEGSQDMITSIASALGLKEIFVKIGLGVLTLLAIGLIIWRVVVWYDNQLDAAFNRGSEAAYAKVDKRATQLANQLTAAAVKLKDQANEEHLAIAVAATDLRVRGPGRASCPAPVDAGSGGHEQILAAEADAGLAVSPENWARVPWDWLVTVVQEHDDLLTEAGAWRENKQQESKIIATKGE
jgi:dsDNA-binding SOS-regulon protein